MVEKIENGSVAQHSLPTRSEKLFNRSLDGITEYAILIISDEHGAVIREAKPPRE